MFIGHFAVGFASKRVAPQASLGVLMAAPLFADMLWPLFLALGVEHARIEPGATAVTPLDLYDYPYSHGLVPALLWSALGGGIYYALRRDRRAAWVIAGGVFSHWVLDWITHRPDMPLLPGDPTRLGLGLWNSLAATLIVESVMFAAGVAVYATCTRARDRTGSIALWSYVALVVVVYLGAVLGPPPPSMQVVTVMGFVAWLFPVWAWWFDRHREVLVA